MFGQNWQPVVLKKEDLGLQGRQLLSEALSPVADQVELLSSSLLGMIPFEHPVTKQALSHILDAPGKRVRPAIFFMSCGLLGYDGPHRLPMAAVAEMVHTASLMHDDIVDNSTLRRGRPTCNAIWGDAAAVLVGDLIYARASELMAQTGELEIVSSFARAIRMMSEGELIQLENTFNFDLTNATYMQILEGKTGVLMGVACRTAGVLAKASPAQLEALETFGKNLGLAFQLLDDALDYLGNRELFGKTPYTDLLEGKITMPIILLREQGNDLQSFQNSLEAREITPEVVQAVADLVARHETAEMTIAIAHTYTTQALELLESHFPPSLARDQLAALALSLLGRSY